MFDTHCHLNFDVFDDSLDKVIKNAREVGVAKFLIPGVDISSSKKAVEISSSYEGVYAAVGIHPTIELEKIDIFKVMENLKNLCENSKKVVAIGEVGLDYYHFKSPARLQVKILKEQIKLSKKLGLSLILHNRLSTNDTLKVLDEMWDSSMVKNVVFHCTSPDKEILDFAVKKKVFLGVDGDVTYDEKKAKFVKDIPLDLLVLETDSPYLTPKKAKKEVRENEPKNLVEVARFVSSLKKESIDYLKKITLNNSLQLFNL